MLQKDQSPVGRDDSDKSWAGFSEIDQAIRENRLTEYRWKKAWADPWGRGIFMCVGLAFGAFVVFVIYQDLIVS